MKTTKPTSETGSEPADHAAPKSIALIARREALMVFADLYDARTERLRKDEEKAMDKLDKAHRKMLARLLDHDADRAALEDAIAAVKRELNDQARSDGAGRFAARPKPIPR